MATPPTRHIVVDDADSAIQYVGPGWTTSSGSAEASFGNFGPVFGDTLHILSNTPASSLQYQFSGTSVSVMGSLDNDGNKTVPTWQCFLDGVSFGKTFFNGITENQQTLCRIGALPDGTHTVTVNVTTSGPTFYFDNIIYDPSPSVSLSDAVVKVDNNDTAIGLSGSGWINRYANLWPLTHRGGDQMVLKFTGKSVTWIGVAPGELNGNKTTGTYAIDGAPPTSFVVPGHGGLGEFNQVYFTTPDVDSGPHTLLITFQGSTNTAPLVLDYFYVTNGTQTLQPSASPTDQGSATASAGPDAAASSAAADTRSGSSAPIGAIVGGVLGGLALIIGALLLFLFYRRRASRRTPHTDMAIIDDPEVRPFTQNTEPYHHARSTSYFTQSDASAPSGATSTAVSAPMLYGAQDLQPLRRGESANGKKLALHAPPPPPPPLLPSHPTTTPAQPPVSIPDTLSSPGTETPSTRRVMHHEDSGVRIHDVEAQEEVVELPPTYTAD